MIELYRNVAGLYGQLGWIARVALVLGFTLVSSGLAMLVVVLLPADYFYRQPSGWYALPLVRWPVLVLKNLLGACLVPLGIVMIPAPGPGLVVLLIGLSLVNFPGKKALEMRLLGRPSVIKSMNGLRARFGRAPLLVQAPER